MLEAACTLREQVSEHPVFLIRTRSSDLTPAIQRAICSLIARTASHTLFHPTGFRRHHDHDHPISERIPYYHDAKHLLPRLDISIFLDPISHFPFPTLVSEIHDTSMSLFYLSDTMILFSSCVCKTIILSRYHLPREWLHDNVDVGIAESQQASLSSRGCRRQEGKGGRDVRT